MLLRALATLPFLGILVGPIFFNRVVPLVFGLPQILAWLLLWVVLTSIIMGLVYILDPANRARKSRSGDAATLSDPMR